MVFNSIEECKQYILNRSKGAVGASNEQVYGILDDALSGFYSEYSPSMYVRTGQLGNALNKTEPVSIGNGWEATSYYDDGFSYSTGANPSGSQVLHAAAYGGHGAEGLHIVAGGNGIWDTPISEISGLAYHLLVQNLIAAGIPIH